MMVEKKNLFIINSPLQLINAIEAIHFFKLKNIIFVMIYNRSKNNIIQLEEQIKKVDYEEIIKIYPSSNNRFFGYVNLIKQLRKYQYDKVFTGELEDSNFRILIANLKKEKLFLLDEGTSTVVDYETKIKQNKLNKYGYKEFRFLVFGFSLKLKDTINFFTYYDFTPLKGGEVIINKLEYMRKDFKQNSVDYGDSLFFLGQPKFIFSDKREFEIILKSVIQQYKDKKIFYIPHREEINILETIKDIDERFKILEINQPIEQYFLNKGIYPKHIISYSSTALFTTKMLFKDCLVEYIKIKKPNINLNIMKYLDIVYKYFEKNGILEFKYNKGYK